MKEHGADFDPASQFAEYRSKYSALEALFDKPSFKMREEKTGFPVGKIKLKGEDFLREPNTSMYLWDHAIHSCGATSYPDYLPSNRSNESWTFSVELDLEQTRCIMDHFGRIDFDFRMFDEAVSRAKGLWIDYLYQDSQLRGLSIENRTGQTGDVLGIISTNYFEVLNEVAGLSQFKKLTRKSSNEWGSSGGVLISIDFRDYVPKELWPPGTIEERSDPEPIVEKLDPLERIGVISDNFLRLFLAKNYQCDHFEETICDLCQEVFLPQTQTNWVGLVAPHYCDMCLTMSLSSSTDFFQRLGYSEQERKNLAIRGAEYFFEVFGFVPGANFQRKRVIAQFLRQNLETDSVDVALRASALLPKKALAVSLFGSWSHLLNQANLLEKADRGRGGYRSIAKDGHLCLSLGERTICEYLYANSVPHDKEPMYPHHPELNPREALRADFLIKGVFIEFAGMMNIPEYATRMQNKEQLAKVKGIRWAKLENVDLDQLVELLEFVEGGD